MHYYQFNIADYRKDTNHLSLLEHGIYRNLLDSYYLNEKPLCGDDADLMRTHCVITQDEQNAFKNILKDFFKKTKKGYIHKKCDEQILKYNQKSIKARDSARARWDAKAMRTHSEGNANHKPITTNHKPIKEKIKRKVFAKPTAHDVECFGQSNLLNVSGFYDYYESNGWKVGRNPMKDWKASARGWSKRQSNYSNQNKQEQFSDNDLSWRQSRSESGVII